VSSTEDHPNINCTCNDQFKDIKCIMCKGNHPTNYKSIIYKDLQNKYFPTLRKKEITSKPEVCKYIIKIGLTRQNLYFSHKNWKQSINCMHQIYRAIQKKITLLSTSQFIKKSCNLSRTKKFTDRMCQLVNSLTNIVTERMQWTEYSK